MNTFKNKRTRELKQGNRWFCMKTNTSLYPDKRISILTRLIKYRNRYMRTIIEKWQQKQVHVG